MLRDPAPIGANSLGPDDTQLACFWHGRSPDASLDVKLYVLVRVMPADRLDPYASRQPDWLRAEAKDFFDMGCPAGPSPVPDQTRYTMSCVTTYPNNVVEAGLAVVGEQGRVAGASLEVRYPAGTLSHARQYAETSARTAVEAALNA